MHLRYPHCAGAVEALTALNEAGAAKGVDRSSSGVPRGLSGFRAVPYFILREGATPNK